MSVLLAACAAPAPSPSVAASPSLAALPSGWITFTSPDGSFSVGLPGQPTVSTQNVITAAGLVQTQIFWFATADQRTGYFSSYSDFPSAYIRSHDPQAMLDGGVQDEVAHAQATLTQSHAIHLAGVPGRDWTATTQGGSMHEHTYLRGTRLYQILIIGSGSGLPNVDAFLASFAILH